MNICIYASLSSRELSNAKVCEPQIRARLGTTSHFRPPTRGRPWHSMKIQSDGKPVYRICIRIGHVANRSPYDFWTCASAMRS